MENHYSYGKLLLVCRDKKARKILRVVMTVIVALGLAFSLLMFIAIDKPDDRGVRYFFGGIIIVFALLLYALIFKYQNIEIQVYEYGFVFRNRKKEIQLSFSEIEGVNESSFRMSYNGIPTPVTKTYTIYPKEGKKICFLNNGIANYDGLTESFDQAFFAYQTNNLTLDNLLLAKISFGKHLKLENGQFIYKNGKVVVPLQYINNLDIVENTVTFCGVGANGEKIEYFSIVTGLMFNILTFNYVINMLTSN